MSFFFFFNSNLSVADTYKLYGWGQGVKGKKILGQQLTKHQRIPWLNVNIGRKWWDT